METFGDAGVKFQSLSEPWANTTTHAGRMIMTVFAGIAEFERDLIRERAGPGRQAAKDRGVRFVRPRKLNSDQIRLVSELLEKGKPFKKSHEPLTFMLRLYTAFRGSRNRNRCARSLLKKNHSSMLKFAFLSLFAVVALSVPPPPSTRDAPFIESFHRAGKTLIYVLAVHHSSIQYPDAMADPVFKTIQEVFSTMPLDAVIIEGVDPSQVASYCERTAQECGVARYNLPGRACGESSVAAYSAAQKGIPVYSGEPSASEELSSFKGHGYTIQDFLAFWILNNIPPEKRHGPLTEEGFRNLVDRIVNYDNHLLGTSVRFSADDFARWYSKNMPSPRNYLDLEMEDASPYPGPQEPKTLLHTLSALSTQERDESIVKTIKAVLKDQDHVLVVYGASHLDFEWKNLVTLMGIPKKTKPF